MNYRDMYLELFRVQADAIEALEEITDKLKIAHLAVEEMLLSADSETDGTS